MAFIFGFVLGRLFKKGEWAGTLLTLPLAVLAVLLFGWGCYTLADWADASLASYTPASWWEHPWHWPGVYWAKQGVDAVLSAIAGDGIAFPAFDDSPFRYLLLFPAKIGLASLGVMINALIVLLPVLLVGQCIRLARWVLLHEQEEGT